MDSCGVGAFSLNYGPQTTRGKSPYVSDPCLSRAVPTTREPHTVQPYYPLKRLPCRKVPTLSSIGAFAIAFHCDTSMLRARPRDTFVRASPTTCTLASCNVVRDSRHHSFTRFRLRCNRSRCPARPANTRRRHRVFFTAKIPSVARFCLATMSRYYNTESRRFR